MKKLMILLLAFCLILGGCTKTRDEKEFTDEESQELLDSANEILRESNSINGFEDAGLEYDRFNSYAEDNGLDGTKIFIEGKVINKAVIEDIIAFNVEQDDENRWVVSIGNSDKNLEMIEELVDSKIRIFGIYLGYSDLFNLPGIGLYTTELQDIAQICIDKATLDGSYETIWTFAGYAQEELNDLDEKEVEKEDTDEGQSAEQVEKPVDEVHNITTGEKNALASAKNYLGLMPFSYNGIIEQLEYEKYSHEEAIYAADNCGADWNEQATKMAKNYLDLMSFSKEGLIDQLEYDGFTHEQAVYGVEQNGS